jgi:hypothetical protein
LAVPEHFFCELCRIARADPFWVRVYANFFSPARLNPHQQGMVLSPNGSPPALIKADREFNVAYPHLQLCGRDDHQLQVSPKLCHGGDHWITANLSHAISTNIAA